ncbi:MAG: protein kinase [Chloroflexi bacterium]|nr:protein kinase [Chloroflexota bacterium]
MSNNETLLNGRYRLIAQQGSGGMAVIYKAQDMLLGRTVAVKVLRPSLTTDPAFMTRFRNEARSVANLNHPNIVTVHDVGNDGSTQYIVMEFIEGQDLKRIIKAEGALSVDRALKLAIQICAGIGFAHRAGLVHADVKPQNILVTRGDLVKVTDFGIAQALSDTQPGERQSVVWGSPHYFAPEQARGEKPTPASDVYSIGIVMFEVLTGRLPYVGTNQQELALAHIREAVPRVTDFNPNVPETLSQIVYKVMSKEPSARYRMADQLGHVLESYRDRGREQTSPNVPAAAPRPATPPPAQPVYPSQQQPPAPAPLPFSQVQPPTPEAPRPSTAAPTQRYSVAPEAPQQGAPYNRPTVPSPFERQQAGQSPPPASPYQQGAPPQQQGWTGNTSQLYPRQLSPSDDIPSAFDAVTIALAVLAFFAVLCLIPLYIAVFQARFG